MRYEVELRRQEMKQKEWKRSPVHVLRQKTQKYCREDIPDGAYLLEIGWYTEEVIASYVKCERCGQKEYYIEENRKQRVIRDRQKWCRCQRREEEKMAWPREAKAQ